MALLYVARRVGSPALRPRAPPSAGFGPLASRSSQAGYSNGNAAGKMKQLGQPVGEKNGAEKMMDEVAQLRASFQATREAIENARRMEKLMWRCFMGSGVAGVGLGLYSVKYVMGKALRQQQ